MLSKNYRLLIFLNKNHSWPMRFLISIAAFIFVFFTSFSVSLANYVRRKVMDNDFKLALRQLHWFASRSYLQLNVIADHFFDFTEGMRYSELESTLRFLKRYKKRNSPFIYTTDQLYILARMAHKKLAAKDQTGFLNLYERYQYAANDALAAYTDLHFEKNIKKLKAETNQFSQNDAREALTDFYQLVPYDELPSYIISGTFLGVIREGGWLAHDYDIDLGIHSENYNSGRLQSLLAQSDHFVIRKTDHQIRIIRDEDDLFQLDRLPTLVKLVHKNGINIDVFIHYLEDDIRWHGSVIHRWDNHDFALTTYNLDGVNVLGAVEADRYLSENYGNWRVPVTDFNCTTGTPNLSVVKNLFSVALFIKRAGFAKMSGDAADAQKIISQLQISGALTISVSPDEPMHFKADFI
ncbi:LicD family protein [Paenochrobactrum pullorum]|uniref:LicD family protein n=1 Tax=Paenochrobactrum pullorum TaxID=1324351 RepID=UPI0035BBD126